MVVPREVVRVVNVAEVLRQVEQQLASAGLVAVQASHVLQACMHETHEHMLAVVHEAHSTHGRSRSPHLEPGQHDSIGWCTMEFQSPQLAAFAAGAVRKDAHQVATPLGYADKKLFLRAMHKTHARIRLALQ